MKKPFLALSLALIGFSSPSFADASYKQWSGRYLNSPVHWHTATTPADVDLSSYVINYMAPSLGRSVVSIPPGIGCGSTVPGGHVDVVLSAIVGDGAFTFRVTCALFTESDAAFNPDQPIDPVGGGYVGDPDEAPDPSDPNEPDPGDGGGNPGDPGDGGGSGGGSGPGSGSQFPPGSPFCIDNPNSPLCENNDNPDLCGIGIGSPECCTAHAVNTCADQGGVYYSNYQQQGNDGHCQVQCWAWTEVPPVTNPEPDYDGFPNADSCYDYAENYCGSGSVWSALYNNNSKSCSVMCSDGSGGDVPDPTAPPPGTPPPPGTNPNPGGSTVIPGQNGDIYVNNDYSGVVDSINGMRQNMDSRLGSLIAAVNNNAPLNEQQTANAVEQGTSSSLSNFFGANPDTVGTLLQQEENARAGELEAQRNAYGLGDRDFSDIPERVVNLDDFTDDYDFSIDGTCPEFWTVQILGETYELDLGPFCTILDLIGTLLVFASYVSAARIAYGGLN